ncbi:MULTISPECIES: NAD(+) diphosphatase [Oceanospirillaceae]|jgi:NAD+ diphosphatase|uniref:NAD(+) diphosphatase n=1 Tax=Oceanobacter antarcticus TaxID=3133425 RepID=A0ABW8NDJ2_9GAMM|tara:strand:- start:1249 stop:2091 length:843 start_codon:yes stop_codon:yes gene_type:complete
MGKIHTFELCDYQPEQHDQPYRYLVISQGQVLSTTAADLTLHSHADVHCRWPELTSQTETVFIGIANRNIPCFVIELAQPVEPEANHWLSPRALMANASADEYVALSRALQLGVWAREHRYCGVCGAPTRQHQTERAMFCEPCNKLYFPRIAPCIITIVTRGEYCLLAHHSRYKVNSYSTLAGFIEAGESIEDAVHREVKEEVGITIRDLEYFGSQSWPFPGQLMVGFIAHYDSGDIVIDDDEISDAQWFHYTRLPETPPPLSISGQLIQTFVDRCRQAQ